MICQVHVPHKLCHHLDYITTPKQPQAGAGTMLNGNHAPVPVQNNSGMAANPNFNPCQRAITELMMTKEFLESDTGVLGVTVLCVRLVRVVGAPLHVLTCAVFPPQVLPSRSL